MLMVKTMDMGTASAAINSSNHVMQTLAKRYHEEQKKRLERQYLIDNFGIYGEYCSLPYVFSCDPEYWAFRNWLVTHRTRLKSVEQVKRSLKNGIPVWRYKAS